LSHDKVSLAKLLPPPPPPNSEAQQRDLAVVLEVQKTRTPELVKRAIADNELSIFRIMDVLGPGLTPERLPLTVRFFKRVHGDARNLINATKDTWQRPRPFLVSDEVKPLGEKPRTMWSYPSGTTIFGSLTAIVLANMVQEKRAEIFARADEYGASRVVIGVHYPSDVEASRSAATAIAAVLMQHPAFIAEFEGARAELRNVLNLP
jgi:acid phosphatase (class A)